MMAKSRNKNQGGSGAYRGCVSAKLPVTEQRDCETENAAEANTIESVDLRGSSGKMLSRNVVFRECVPLSGQRRFK